MGLKGELVRLAHAKPEFRKHLIPLIKRAGTGPDQTWWDGDRSAPKTPWGPAQDAYNIARGVTWYSTAGHGGLMVARGVAQKMLSDAARKMGDFWGGAFWYEEDVQWAIPFYEHPEWDVILVRKAGGSPHNKKIMADVIKRSYPKYFEMVGEV